MSMPYAGQQFTFHNPDGSTLEVRGFGDQSAAVFETLDGYTVVEDPASGYFHYATLSPDGASLTATGARAGAAGATPPAGLAKALRPAAAAARAGVRAATSGPLTVQRRWEIRRGEKQALLQTLARSGAAASAQAAPPPAATTGNYVGLCLLVQFPDVPGTIAQAEVDRFCNQKGYTGFGNNGSVTDYFEAVSDHKLHYTLRVAPYYTAKHPRAYYTDPAVGYGIRAQELIAEALASLLASGFDVSALSSDGAGFVYALNVFYAAKRTNSWAKGLWPHSSALANRISVKGKTFSDYQITDMDAQLTLRTFCHENGHMICDFPDLYDTGYESVGIGNYCLMCYGGSDTNPTQVNAYLKHAAGWASKTTLLTPGLTATIAAGSNDFLLHAKSPTEYFILENRQQAGRDAALPDGGLAIWHADRLGSNNSEQMTAGQHYECALVQADNRADLEHNANHGDATDLYGGASAVTFGAATAPNSLWWNGEASGLEIEQISAPGPSMTLHVRYPGPLGQMKQVFAGVNGVIYAIAGNGDLWWYRHDGRANGGFAWSADSPKQVGVGWGGLRRVFAAGEGVIYGINDAGDLLWYRHDGHKDGSFSWAAGSPKKVGIGWGGLRRVFAAGDGVIYGIHDNGDLLWYRHDGRQNGSFTWAAGSPKKVGTGWGALRSVLCGGDDGVIYGINDVGDLLWYRHDGRGNGSFSWAAGSPKKVGTGWGSLRTVFYGGDGVLYGAADNGDLLWYRHDGRHNGSFTWAAGSPKKVGSGWLVAGHGVIYAVEPSQVATGSAPRSGGHLLWYRHDGRTDGSFVWAAGSPKQVGVGWGTLKTVFAGSDGVVYGIDALGQLLWYRHDGRDEGEFLWAQGSPKVVGTGWGALRRAFSGDDGVVYGIDANGDLLWYRHEGRHDGSFSWAAGSPKKVGSGWGGLATVFSGGAGVLYGVDANGDLLWYRHDGHADGSFAWAAGSPKKVGSGWGGLSKLFSGGDGVIYGVDANGDLLWYRHDGRHDGSFAWAAAAGKKVGVGWGSLPTLFGAG